MVTAPDIPGHKVGGVLGSGGYATVYRAWQVAVGREVAVKVDNRVLLSDRDQRRFVREVTAAGRLSGHPHVIDVYDAGTLADGRPYLVMELCPAGSLNDALRRHGPMSPARVRDIGIKIADALAAAHTAGILHRDIKPANILVNRYGMVGLSDFGLASIIAAGGDQTASREALTPAYAPPESFRGEEPTAAADLYSLTATLYALLAGRPRFPADGRPPSPAMIMALQRPAGGRCARRTAGPDGTAARRAGRGPGRPAAERAGAARRPHPPGHAAPGTTAPGTTAPGSTVPGTAVPGCPVPGAGTRDATGPRCRGGQSGPRPGWRRGGRHGRRCGWPRGGPAPATAQERCPGRPGRRAAPGRTGRGHAGRGRTAAPGHARVWRPTALAVAVIVIAGAAAVLGARFLPHRASATTSGNSPAGGSPDVFGIPTVTAGCPAASVRVARARCPQQPECWAGMTVISGSATARSLPCTRPHYWETFAIGILPSDARTFDQPTLEKNPVISAVCSLRVMLASRHGRGLRIPASAWRVDVLPPAEAAFYSGTRAYRCVANVLYRQPRTSMFRR